MTLGKTISILLVIVVLGSILNCGVKGAPRPYLNPEEEGSNQPKEPKGTKRP